MKIISAINVRSWIWEITHDGDPSIFLQCDEIVSRYSINTPFDPGFARILIVDGNKITVESHGWIGTHQHVIERKHNCDCSCHRSV